MFFLLQVCFWIEAALAFRIYWDRVFCSCVLFLPKSNTGKRCSCGCVFLAWGSTGQGVKLRRFQVERARNLQDEKKSFEELLVILCENFALQISRLEDLSICVFAYQKVWGCEDEKICRCEEDTKLKKGCENERMRLCEELKVWGQEYK